MEKFSLCFDTQTNEHNKSKGEIAPQKEIAIEHKRAVFEICLAIIEGLRADIESLLEVIQVVVVGSNYDNQGWTYVFDFTMFLRDPFGSKDKLKAYAPVSVPSTISDKQISFMREHYSKYALGAIDIAIANRASSLRALLEKYK